MKAQQMMGGAMPLAAGHVDPKENEPDRTGPPGQANPAPDPLRALSADWVWRTDCHHRFVEVTHDARSVSRQAFARSAIGLTRWEIRQIDLDSADWAAHRRALDRRESIRAFEYSWQDPEVGTRWMQIDGDPLFTPNGRFSGYHGTARDVTARRMAELRAERVNAMYAALAGVADAVARSPDPDTMTRVACESLCRLKDSKVVVLRLFDPDRRVLVPRACAGLVEFVVELAVPGDGVAAPDAAPPVRAFLLGATQWVDDYGSDPRTGPWRAAAKAAGVGASASISVRRAGAIAGELSIYAAARYWFDAELIALAEQCATLIGTGLDNFDRAAAQRDTLLRLDASKERHRRVSAIASDWHYETDAELRMKSISPDFYRLTGNDPASVIGKVIGSWQQLRPGEQDAFPVAKLMRERRSFRHVEFPIRDLDGRVRWRSASGEPIYDANGRFTGYLGATSDITRRKEAELRAERMATMYAAQAGVAEAVARASDERAMLAQCCEALIESGTCVATAIRVVDADSAFLVEAAASRASHIPHDMPAARVPISTGPQATMPPSVRAFVAGETRFVENYQTDPSTVAWRAIAAKLGIISHIATPLLRNGNVVGVLSLYGDSDHGVDLEATRLVERCASLISHGWATLDASRARDKAQSDLRCSEERYRRLNAISSDWYWERDENLVLSYLSPSFYEITGHRPEEVIGSSLDEFGPHAGDDAIREEYLGAMRAHKPFRDIEYARRDPDGVLRWRSHSGDPIFDEQGRFLGYRGTGRDVTERKSHEALLRHQASVDALTELPNRASMREELGQAILRARQDGSTIAVMLLDLDEFKHVNDSVGHDAGDRLLCEMAGRLRACASRGETVARLGGDEFVVIAPNECADSRATALGERILESLTAPWQYDGAEFVIGASIGVSVFPRDGDDPSTLLRNADVAMYQAKQEGRRAMSFYSPVLTERAGYAASMRAKLRRAIDAREFALHYQPIVDTASASLVGAEALIRWPQPDGTMIPPDEFIPLAEESGLIAALGHWVLGEACRQSAAWRDAGFRPPTISVNLSPRQFRHGNLIEEVATALRSAKLPANALKLELTETVMMQAPDEVAKIVRELARIGVQTSIDDFGTGYSSLAYLREFHVSDLKIDRAFIRGVLERHEDATIVRAVISLAHALELQVVAEGVETEEHWRHLARIGCDRIQGYFVSRPVSAQAFEDFMRPGWRASVRPAEPQLLRV